MYLGVDFTAFEDDAVFARLFVIRGMTMELGLEMSFHLCLKFSVLAL